jgi:hypothetical protein
MIFTAFILGLGGALHCMGMCSPLVMSITSFSKQVWMNRFLYNAGRIFTYGILGFLVSLMGSQLRLNEYQTTGTILVGALLILMGLGQWKSIHVPLFSIAMQKLVLFIKLRYTRILSGKNSVSQILLGGLNGLLPCGLTYVALSYAIFEEPQEGFLFMILFGVGTLPAMIGLTWLLHAFIKRWSIKLSYFNSAAMIFIGLLLLGRVFSVHNHSHEVSSPLQDPVICNTVVK